MPDNGQEDIAIRAIAGQPEPFHYWTLPSAAISTQGAQSSVQQPPRAFGRQGCAERGKGIAVECQASSLPLLDMGRQIALGKPLVAPDPAFPLQESSAIFGNMGGEFWACPLSKAVCGQKIGQARLCPRPSTFEIFSRQGLASFAPGAPQSPADCRKGPREARLSQILAAAPHRPNRHDAQIAIRGQHFSIWPRSSSIRVAKSETEARPSDISWQPR